VSSGAAIPTELSADELADYLAGTTEICGSAFEDRARAATRALVWFRALQGFGYDAIPFLAVHDVGHLLVAGDAFPFRAVADLDRWGEVERPVRLAYENRFLNALRSDGRFRRFIQIISAQEGAEPRKIDSLVQRALEIVFAPARLTRLASAPRINPVHLRDLTSFESFSPEDSRRRFEAKRPGWFLQHLAEFLARQAPLVDLPRTVREEDFFELAHWEALDRPHRRLFARRVQELVTGAGPLDVARTQVRVESQEATTMVADEGTYPTGGIGEITTKGSIENLVRSELVYRYADSPVDLFALRWAEGDLLFYTRDSGALHRKRRTLVLALDPAKMRVKDPRHVVSLAVLAYALIARVSDDLLELFGGEGARVEIRILSPKPLEADREEMQLFQLRLREAIRRGDASIGVQPSLDAAALIDPRRRTFVVAFGDVPVDVVALERAGGSLIRVRLEAPPAAGDDGESLYLDPATHDLGEAVGAMRDELLTRVVGVR
jgi:hypothetical protein